MSMQSFADLGVSRAVAGALAERGITEPFAIQKLVIADILAGHDVLAKSPTGSGKTIAFGAPIADRIEASDRRPAALILAPTRELTAQIVDDLRPMAQARALKIASVYGGVGIVKQAREAAHAHIVVATPGRLEDLLQRGALKLDRVQILVLDEADRMLDMGFRPAVDRIVAQCPRERQTLFFSATLAGEVGTVAKHYTHDARRHEHIPKVTSTAAIEHRFLAVERDERIDALLGELRGERELALVFVRTKRGVDRLVKRLSREGVNVVGMHGDKSQGQRERALASFESFQRRHPRRHRRRRARHRRRRDLARHQLRPARRPRRLRAPHRAHRPRGAHRRRRDLRRRRAGARRPAHRGRARPRPRVRGDRAELAHQRRPPAAQQQRQRSRPRASARAAANRFPGGAWPPPPTSRRSTDRAPGRWRTSGW